MRRMLKRGKARVSEIHYRSATTLILAPPPSALWQKCKILNWPQDGIQNCYQTRKPPDNRFYNLSFILASILFSADVIYRSLVRRWSFIFFPKSFQNLSQNCKFLLCLLFSVSQSSIITNAQSYFLTN